MNNSWECPKCGKLNLHNHLICLYCSAPENKWEISENAARIISQRPWSWEYRLYAQVLADEIQENLEKYSQNNSLVYSEIEQVLAIAVPWWIEEKFTELTNLFDELLDFSKQIDDIAIKPSGHRRSELEIIELAKWLGEFHRTILIWIRLIKTTLTDSQYNDIVVGLTHIAIGMISDLEKSGPKILKEMDDVEGTLSDDETYTSNVADLTIDFDQSVVFRLNLALSRLGNSFDSKSPVSHTDDAGYIYLLTNPSMDGLVKLGKTKRLPKDRAKELSGPTGVPTPYKVIFEAYVSDHTKAERYVHDRLKSKRVPTNKEFFKITPTEAIRIMLEAEEKFGFRKMDGA